MVHVHREQLFNVNALFSNESFYQRIKRRFAAAIAVGESRQLMPPI
jgi:hypothetical protein